MELKSLIGKLNETARGALEAAAGLCLARTHYDIEIEHYLLKLMDVQQADLQPILGAFHVDRAHLAKELNSSLDKLKRGNARTPAFSPSLLQMLREAWIIGSIDFGVGQIRSGFTVLAIAATEELRRQIHDTSRELAKIEPEKLRKEFVAMVSGSSESASMDAVEASSSEAGGFRGSAGKSPNLDQYTEDLTAKARAGKIDPVMARDSEVRQIIDILMRRRQNNPILTGEAGVGKTAVVEGFAARVAKGDVPPPLRNVAVRTLDLALLQAGAGIKGEFENRLKGLVQEIKNSPIPIILFIDEAHTMIGAGGAAGQNDAANILKPALARGDLRTIAATTWSEYKKYFEKDPALARRFQVVKVDEPTEEQCRVMMRGIVPALERHHGVRITDDGLTAAVRFSHRYLPDRHLPDKAVSVLDTACARVALGRHATPAALEDTGRRIDDLAVQKRVLEREASLGADHSERLHAIAEQQDKAAAERDALQARWQRETTLVSRTLEIHAQLQAGAEPVAQPGSPSQAAPALDVAALRAELGELDRQLQALQGESPLINICVDARIVGDVVSAWTGIPIRKMLRDEIETVLSLDQHLGSRVIGQAHALAGISDRIRTSKAGIEDPGKPIGVFLLVGPSGVGKTETALALSDLLYGGERNVITINMSEFQEAHTISTLKGSPPGYVGYGEGGVLTEAVRRRPYSVVLLDEVEKAHPDVLEVFYQVFDKGAMEDGEGRQIDFKNTIIILTSNAGTNTLMKLTSDPEAPPSAEMLVGALKPELNRIFKPAFLGRLVIIPYFPIRDEALKRIVVLKLAKIQRRIEETHRIALTYDQALIDEVARRCTEVESGARNVDNILTNTLMPEISRKILGQMVQGESIAPIHVGVGGDGSFLYT